MSDEDAKFLSQVQEDIANLVSEHEDAEDPNDLVTALVAYTAQMLSIE